MYFGGALCVLASVNKQVVDLSDELARKVEDSLRQQEEISSLLAQIVDLQARCKGVRCSGGSCTTAVDFIKKRCNMSLWWKRLQLKKKKNLFAVSSVSFQLTHENEELNQTLSASRESQIKLKAEARH